MGRMTLSAEQTVTPGPEGTTIVNEATYTAPNGHTLKATFAGEGTFPDETGTVCFRGTETYTGGTGRFAGALGSAQVRGCASLPRQRGFFVARGTIRY